MTQGQDDDTPALAPLSRPCIDASLVQIQGIRCASRWRAAMRGAPAAYRRTDNGPTRCGRTAVRPYNPPTVSWAHCCGRARWRRAPAPPCHRQRATLCDVAVQRRYRAQRRLPARYAAEKRFLAVAMQRLYRQLRTLRLEPAHLQPSRCPARNVQHATFNPYCNLSLASRLAPRASPYPTSQESISSRAAAAVSSNSAPPISASASAAQPMHWSVSVRPSGAIVRNA